MSDTVFNKVDYTLNSLMDQIAMGSLGLPDIQRPFVWKNLKVRDLFDSMYRGYPVGYLLFWKNTLPDSAKQIGSDRKQKHPSLVIVDGQQRLTALYAVTRNVPVVRDNIAEEHIRIAFNPLEHRFEVADAAIDRDKTFIPDISTLWDSSTDIFEVVDGYLEGVKLVREIGTDESKALKSAIMRLQGLLSYPFTALELASNIDEEAVSEVFVRINSKGTPLNQADFILTLMSVFWDEGRKELERFCRDARKPSKTGTSPFNHFIDPSPDQLLRVGVGVAFKRARLQYVYSILRGKDLETGEFSDERRVQQFDLLKEAQAKVLNLQYWHDFMNCMRMAGFRSGKMISSKNNLIFSYILYLIGRTEYNVPEFDLRKGIARWFFMSAVTGRFTGSPETAMGFDMARLRDVKSADEFLGALNRICELTLTNDYWNTTLPNDLATSSPRSPSLFAYHAAQVLLDAKALFSNVKIADLLDPSISAAKSMVERHHLFPKAYLAKQGLKSTRDTNQIANYALVEWGDNIRISDRSPVEYMPEMKKRFSADELNQMYHWHALPENWEHLEYKEFLEKRRDLIALVIAEGYATLKAEAPTEVAPESIFDLAETVMSGESEHVEFKSTLRMNLHTGNKDPKMELAVLKTLAGFLNSKGGTLVIGVADDGDPVGVEADAFPNEDKMSLHLINIVKDRMGPGALVNMHMHFDDHDECRVMVVQCQESSEPIYVKDGNTERFYVRMGPATTELTPSQIQPFVKQRFKG